MSEEASRSGLGAAVLNAMNPEFVPPSEQSVEQPEPENKAPEDQSEEVEEQPESQVEERPEKSGEPKEISAESDQPEEAAEPETTPEQDSQQPETPSVATKFSDLSDDDISDFLYDQTGGKIDTIAELKELVDKAESAAAGPTYSSPLVQQMAELDRKGVEVTPELMLELQTDYKAMDHTNHDTALNLILKKMKVEDPGITDTEVRLLMKEFQIDEDSMDDDEIEMRKAKSIREARKAKQFLEENKAQYVVPTVPSKEQQAKQQAEAQEAREALTKTIRSAARELKEVTFDVNGDDYTYQLSSEDSKLLRDEGLNTPTFWNRFYDESKNLKGKELMEFFAWSNPEMRAKMLSVVKGQAAAEAKESVVKDLKNSSAPKQPSDSQPKSAKSHKEQIAAAYIGSLQAG